MHSAPVSAEQLAGRSARRSRGSFRAPSYMTTVADVLRVTERIGAGAAGEQLRSSRARFRTLVIEDRLVR